MDAISIHSENPKRSWGLAIIDNAPLYGGESFINVTRYQGYSSEKDIRQRILFTYMPGTLSKTSFMMSEHRRRSSRIMYSTFLPLQVERMRIGDSTTKQIRRRNSHRQTSMKVSNGRGQRSILSVEL